MGIVMGGASYVLSQRYDPKSTPQAVTALITLGIGLLIGAVFLRATKKLVEFSFDVPFGEARATLIISWLIGIGAGFLPLVVALAMPDVLFLSVIFLSFPIVLLVQARVFAWRLSVTFGKALLISLVMVALCIVFFGITALIAFGIWQLSRIWFDAVDSIASYA